MERLDEASRRQILAGDAPLIGKPFSLTGGVGLAVHANTRHMALMLMDRQIPDRASRMAAFVQGLVDVTSAAEITQPLACGKGCSHCCTTYVSSTLPEVFRLAQAIRGKTETQARVMAAAARSKAMPQLQRESDRVVCPILVDHACSEYLHRPVICRAVLSVSLDRCLRIFQQASAEPFAYPAGAEALRAYIVIMIRAALILAGLPHQHYELTHALEIALTAEDAESRWLAGEALFAPVAIDRAEAVKSQVTEVADGLAAAVRPTL